jgi:hypothetical protein
MPRRRRYERRLARERRVKEREARLRMLAHAEDTEEARRARRVKKGTLSDVQLQLRIQLWDAIHYGRSLYGKRCFTLPAFFKAVDQDKNGIVGHDELREALVRLDVGTTLPQLTFLLRTMDSDSDGTVCFNEFASWMRGEVASKDPLADYCDDVEEDNDTESGTDEEKQVATTSGAPAKPTDWRVWAPDLIYDDEYVLLHVCECGCVCGWGAPSCCCSPRILTAWARYAAVAGYGTLSRSSVGAKS